MSKFFIGIDLGGTNIKLALVDAKSKILEQTEIPTSSKAPAKTVINEIMAAIKKFKKYKNVYAIGVGVAGDVDYASGTVRFSPNLPKWRNVKVKAAIERLSGKKVFVDNDANTAALGAFWLDAKGKPQNLICLTLGTGVGGGIIINKSLYRGSSNTAGEIGHMTIDYAGHKCNCGNRGCIETHIGANYLARRASMTPKELYASAAAGNKTAKALWQDAGQKLGIAIANILNILNPDIIVLCGGISQAGKFVTVPMEAEIKSRAFKSAARACKIIVSKYTSKLGVVGAAMLAQNK